MSMDPYQKSCVPDLKSEWYQIAVKEDIDLLAEAFELFPLPDTTKPTPDEWANFLREHPGYLQGSHMGLATILVDYGRAATDGLGENYDAVAGVIVRHFMSDEELMIHGGFKR